MSKSAVPTRVALASVWSDLSQQMQRHFDGVVIGVVTEELHAYRVALRKTRALLKLYLPYLSGDVAGFAREFSWVSAATGPVRDLDVLLQFGRQKIPGLLLCEPRELAPILGMLQRERERAQLTLRKVLHSARYRELIKTWGVYLREQLTETMVPTALQTPTSTLARVILIEQCVRLLQQGIRVEAKAAAAEFHALRIRVKRVRYLLALLAPFNEDSRSRELEKPLARMQSLLGEYQDAVATRERLDAMHKHPLQGVIAEKILRQWIDIVDAQQMQARAGFPDVLRKLVAACGESI